MQALIDEARRLALVEEGKRLAMKIIKNQILAENLNRYNCNINMDHVRKLCFIHNPKCMGTSLKGWLGLPTQNADHQFPTLAVNKAVWEAYTTIVVVRNPVDRFVSSFNFHCRSGYDGGYLLKYPDLKEWRMEDYFQRMRVEQPYVVAPQWKYTTHLNSEAGPNHLIRMEDSAAGIQRLADDLGIQASIPGLNRSSGSKPTITPKFRTTLEDYYLRDFETFGY
jgi:hypothetical protein